MNNQMYIVKQYFKITFRNLNRFKIQSFTAVFGLAFALLCFVPALYWMYYETTYDGFIPMQIRYAAFIQWKSNPEK